MLTYVLKDIYLSALLGLKNSNYLLLWRVPKNCHFSLAVAAGSGLGRFANALLRISCRKKGGKQEHRILVISSASSLLLQMFHTTPALSSATISLAPLTQLLIPLPLPLPRLHPHLHLSPKLWPSFPAPLPPSFPFASLEVPLSDRPDLVAFQSYLRSDLCRSSWLRYLHPPQR